MAGIAATVFMTGCGGSTRPLSAAQLASKVIDAPDEFEVDPTKGASGQITPQLFSQYGGTGGTQVAAASDFVAGFRQNYVDTTTEEGISVTILEFKNKATASEYFRKTVKETLSFSDPTYSAVPSLAGAVEASGTKTYDGNYVHGVVDTTGKFYFQLDYEDPVSDEVPVELRSWSQIQWALLQPGVKTPSQASPTT